MKRDELDRPRRQALRSGLAFSAVFGAAWVGCLAPAQAASISGERFDDRVQLSGTELVLNGLGLRAVLVFKGFAAALYLPRPARSALAIHEQSGPKRLQLRMLREVPAQEFAKAFVGGVKKHTTADEQAAMAERMARFERLILSLGTLRDRDEVWLDWLPGQGLLLSLNGKPRGEPIAGADLYRGVLNIFIGDHPVDKRLKAGLLGEA